MSSKAEIQSQLAKLTTELRKAKEEGVVIDDFSDFHSAFIEFLGQEKEQGRSLARLWNGFVDCLTLAEDLWDKFQELVQETSPDVRDRAPLMVQKAVARFPKARFVVMLPRFVDFYRAQGGLEAMKINLEKEEEDG